MKEKTEELLFDLLCKKAVYGLTSEEESQLEALENELAPDSEFESIELTVAQLNLAGVDSGTELPENLRSRIAAEAERYFDEAEVSAGTGQAAAETPTPRMPLFSWLGWAAAAAASIMLVLNIYTNRIERQRLAQDAQPTPTVQEQFSPELLRQKLIESAPDLARASWAPGNVKGIQPQGDIVWSDQLQKGYMRFTGLPVNDPNKETYQLWIFDETQSDKTPIDGGIFSVNSEGEIIIPVNAKLRPRNTKMFAVTLEKPGGVVVSGRERIAALGKRET